MLIGLKQNEVGEIGHIGAGFGVDPKLVLGAAQAAIAEVATELELPDDRTPVLKVVGGSHGGGDIWQIDPALPGFTAKTTGALILDRLQEQAPDTSGIVVLSEQFPPSQVNDPVLASYSLPRHSPAAVTNVVPAL